MLENHLYSTCLQRFASVLVEYSTDVHSGDEVAIVSSTATEPLLQLLYTEVLDLGGHHYFPLQPWQWKRIWVPWNTRNFSIVHAT